jgi:DNA processing protein
MDNHELRHWVALKSVGGVGNIGFKNLIDVFGTPKKVFTTPFHALKEVPGISTSAATNIIEFNDWKHVDEDIEVLDKTNTEIITYLDSRYPHNLLNIYDFPVFLYVRGTFKEHDIYLAIVGSRKASTYGKFCTEKFSRELALKGFTIVSGLARGIDSAAHKGAIAGKGRTVAVLGCGIDITYPPENKNLFMDIVNNGAVITEFPLGTPPNAPNFPSRNRIISGLSLGVLVVEAGEKSGSLITARTAIEQGREVFAIPGSIDSAGSRGTNQLIKQGAKLVEDTDEIIEEILPQVHRYLGEERSTGTMQLQKGVDKEKYDDSICATIQTDDEKIILKAISSNVVDVDTIITTTGFKAGDVQNMLLNLELQGVITQLPGKLYTRKE